MGLRTVGEQVSIQAADPMRASSTEHERPCELGSIVMMGLDYPGVVGVVAFVDGAGLVASRALQEVPRPSVPAAGKASQSGSAELLVELGPVGMGGALVERGGEEGVVEFEGIRRVIDR